MKRRWLIIPIAAGLLVSGLTAGAVLAHGGGGDGAGPADGLAPRVASILGQEEGEVRDAIQQARREMMDERVQSKLDHMVEAGRITPEQAGEFLAWFQARPDDMPFGHGFRGHGLRGLNGHHGFGHSPAPDGPDPDA